MHRFVRCPTNDSQKHRLRPRAVLHLLLAGASVWGCSPKILTPLTSTNALSISPSSFTLITGESRAFSSQGAVGNVTYSMLSGNGSITPSGFYTASASSGAGTD